MRLSKVVSIATLGANLLLSNPKAIPQENPSLIKEVRPNLQIRINKSIETLSANSQWYTISKGKGEPKIIILNDDHEISRSGEDYILIFDKLRELGVKIIGSESYLTVSKDPYQSFLDMKKEIDQKIIDCAKEKGLEVIYGDQSQSKLLSHIQASGIKAIGLEEEDLFKTQSFMTTIPPFFRYLTSNKEKEVKYFKEVYEIMCCGILYFVIPQLLGTKPEEIRKFSTEFINTYLFMANQRSDFAAKTIRSSLLSRLKRNDLGLILFGAMHTKRISDSLISYEIPHIIIANCDQDKLIAEGIKKLKLK